MQLVATEDEEPQIISVGDEELNEEAVAHINRTLKNDETPVASAGFDFETKVLVITDQRVLITGGDGLLNLLNHDDIVRMRREGRELVIETGKGYEHRYRFGEHQTVEELAEIAEAVASLRETDVAPAEDANAEEQTESEGGRRGFLDRAKGFAHSAKQKVSRSVEAMTGTDIRRFDEFTDATTTAVGWPKSRPVGTARKSCSNGSCRG